MRVSALAFPLSHAVMAAFVALLWGGDFVALKDLLKTLPPLFTVAVTFGVVAILMLPWLRWPKGHGKSIFLISLTMGALHFGLITLGMAQGLSVAATVIASQMNVPFTCIFAAIWLKERLVRYQWFGLALAFCGIVLLTGAPDVADAKWGLLMVMSGAACWSLSNIQIKLLHEVPSLALYGWVSTFAAPQLFLVSMIFEGNPLNSLTLITPHLGALIAYNAVGAGILATGVWFWLLKRHPASQVAPFSLLVPFFSVALAFWLLDEALTQMHLVGGVVTLAGVWLVMWHPSRRVLANA